METAKIARALRAGRGYWWPTRRLQIIYALLKVVRVLLKVVRVLLKVVRVLLEMEHAARPGSTALYEADLNLDITIGKIAQARQDAWAGEWAAGVLRESAR